jgi:Glycosyl hydrolase family 65 central catalytic domain/Glycosyl hydrolase family 65, C-terminal domain
MAPEPSALASRQARTDAVSGAWPEALKRRFEAIVFDWDGTAVTDRRADTSELRDQLEALLAAGVEVAVISGTHLENIDEQLRLRPHGPGRLYCCVNRGSEVYEISAAAVELRYRRQASGSEDAALDLAAEGTLDELARRGLREVQLTVRFNRRKVDLIPTPEWSDPPKSSIAALLRAVNARLHRSGIDSLAEVVSLASGAASRAGLGDARVTTDAKHVEIGLTDKSDSVRWLMRTWWSRGLGPGLVAIAGDEMGPLGGVPGSDSYMLVAEASRATVLSVGVEPEGTTAPVIHVGGGPRAFVAFLVDQRARHEGRELPGIDVDPLWSLDLQGAGHRRERARQVLLALSAGRVASGGALCLRHPTTPPSVYFSGAYRGSGEASDLLPCPTWQSLAPRIRERSDISRTLDLRTGVLSQTIAHPESTVRALSFSAQTRTDTVALAVEGLDADGARSFSESARDGAEVTAVFSERGFASPVGPRLDRIATYQQGSGARDVPPASGAEPDFEALLREQREAWAARWEQADVIIEGDDELQRTTRFALYHLMSQVADSGEACVGARGITGSAYRGHVFWDADVFVLPFFVLTHPPAARAMLEYRLRRLPAARARARAAGGSGARFPWESAATGEEVSPTFGLNEKGGRVPIFTGGREEHISADVAWSACVYADWTGDHDFMQSGGAELVVETARYWASRCRRDTAGRTHIYGVIGPDEYHESVDDNAFTNVMARWNLRRAARLRGVGAASVKPDERRTWESLAETIVDGYDPGTGIYEQFAGFFRLEPLIIADAASHRPIAADVLLGRERVAGAQVVKQPDVLMLHHMVPDELVAGSLAPNLAYYEPRTAHGSSLSPGVHAALLARAGRTSEALDLLRIVSRIDLDDITTTTSGGVHLAAMGSLWQAIVFGFAGLRLTNGGIGLDPHLPDRWSRLSFPLRVQGQPLRVSIQRDELEVDAAEALLLRLPGPVAITARAGTTRVVRNGDARWEIA